MAQQDKIQVMEDSVIRRKITRMAYEIIENHPGVRSMILAGIEGQGFVLAGLLNKELKKISEMDIELIKVAIDKKLPEKSDVKLSKPLSSLKKKPVILVDDVLNTGKILTHSMKPFLEQGVARLSVAVLVNRSHLLFPVRPDYTGLELSTTLTEHIEVVLDKKSAVFLH
ncbi:MAG: phosphoribosyltransferase family protein [Cyclobacteriaceae bacterium]